jgi:xanthine dehydrogenase accessory factor
MTQPYVKNRIVVRGAGDVASGVIRRLVLAGYQVIALEKPFPECVRRLVCFAEAFYEKQVEVEGVNAVLVKSVKDAVTVADYDCVPLLIDPDAKCLKELNPAAVVDGRMLKKDIDTHLFMAPIVIGLGPGFIVRENCHAAVETKRGIDLGRVFYSGSPECDTGTPAPVRGAVLARVLRAPTDGKFKAACEITDMVKSGGVIGGVDGTEVRAEIGGVVRGLIHDGLKVARDQKIGDIDPRGKKENCYKISDKANAVAGGVLEALAVIRRKIAN